MTAAAPAWPAAYHRLPIPAAAFEVLAYLIVVAAATLAFTAGWLPVNLAVVLTVALLASLILLSWIHLGQGRHPVFLFLCTLMLFQSGRLVAYCLGVEPEPLRIILMTGNPFIPTKEEQGIVLLCIVLAALCVYAPCRWRYLPISPPDDRPVKKYLPYLYLLFLATLPVQAFKNYRYYEYASAHGGYLSIFVNHSALALSVPLWVRAIPIVTFPVFVAIFVFERRKGPLYATVFLYFATASIILVLGSRGAAVSLILALWWVARIKSRKRTSVLVLAVLALVMLFVGEAIRQYREDAQHSAGGFSATEVVAIQGVSLNVTELAVKYRDHFAPYFGSYMARELLDAFVASDARTYYRGMALGFDASVLMDAGLFSQGHGVANSYIAEAYVGGALLGVALASLGIGFGLAFIFRYSSTASLLFLFAMGMPDVLLMPRGALLDWLSVLARNGISILLLCAGWRGYLLVVSIRRRPDMESPKVLFEPDR